MRIQHNIMAMNAYRNYTNNTSALSKNLEKLSSGYKINRAGDDAAGLAISEKMRAQITGLSTAQKNAKDGISLIQTAEGALTEVHSMLNRMVELADQSANGTYDNDVDRANLQKEFEALRDEIDRIAEASNFNGIKLLDGSLNTKAVAGEVIDLSSALPGVGNELGVNTVLNKDATAAAKGQFSVDLGNVAFNGAAAGTDANGVAVTADVLSITLGSGTGALTLSIEGTGNPMTAGQIATAFVDKYGDSGSNATDVEIGGQKFTVAASGNTLVFTQKEAPTNANEVVDTSLSVKLTHTASNGAETVLKQRDRSIQDGLVYDNMRTSGPSTIAGSNKLDSVALTSNVNASFALATDGDGANVLTTLLSSTGIGGGEISLNYNTGNNKFEMFVGNTLVAESGTFDNVPAASSPEAPGTTVLSFTPVSGLSSTAAVATITINNTDTSSSKDDAALASEFTAKLAKPTGLTYVNGTGATQAVASGAPVTATLPSSGTVDFSGLDLKAIATALGTAAGGDLTLEFYTNDNGNCLGLFVGGTQIGEAKLTNEALTGATLTFETMGADATTLGTITLTKNGQNLELTDFKDPIHTGVTVKGANDGSYETLASVAGTAATAAAIGTSDLKADFRGLFQGNLANVIDSLNLTGTDPSDISINLVSADGGGIQVQLKSGGELLATSEAITSAIGSGDSIDVAFSVTSGMSLGSIKLTNGGQTALASGDLETIAEGDTVTQSGLTFNPAVKVQGGGDTPSGEEVKVKVQISGDFSAATAVEIATVPSSLAGGSSAVKLTANFSGLDVDKLNGALADMTLTNVSSTDKLVLNFNTGADRFELKLGDNVVAIGEKADAKARASTNGALGTGDNTITFFAVKEDNGALVADKTKVLGNVVMKNPGANAVDLVTNAADVSLDPTATPGGTITVTPVADDPVSNKVLSGDYNVGTTVIQASQTQGDSRLASTKFTLTSDMVQDGAKLKIGDQTFVFAVGDKSTVAAGSGELLVDLKDLGSAGTLSGTELSEAAKRITVKAAGNGVFSVGHNGAEITVTEKDGQEVAKNLDTMEGIAAQLGATSAGKAGGKGLTLQIGEDSKSHNQLNVSVSDMHAKALGLANISIGKQGDAALAVDVIKQAINSVSSTRGDLGAMQNRLEHTINNLSVMTENIQDAEATIRDVDVAEEMMAYTKNNILVQSAQAMLAQANQLPQGVLQLLQYARVTIQ